MSEAFGFEELSAITDFREVVDPTRYTDVPASWCVVLTDVCGSTRAIEEGRYKDVNAIGAASIVALRNAVGGGALPYVFGGDGTTALIDGAWRADAEQALRGVAQVAKTAFGFELRVAVVPIAELNAAGHRVTLARYELAPYVHLAMLGGSGVGLAETWVKSASRGPEFQVDLNGPTEADFSGFECRWRPLPSRRGRVVSLLVEARCPSEAENTALYRLVLDELQLILEGFDGRPLSADRMTLRSVLSQFPEESRIHAGSDRPEDLLKERRRIQRKTAIGRFLIAAGLKGGDFDGATYRESLVRHTDFRKFDGLLRMVLDLTHEQIERLRALLTRCFEQEQLFYGLHESDAALVTCCVDDYRAHHVHFVDGSEGGYALAAKELKRQKRAATAS